MMILSKFHDYYDTALKYGIEKDIKYQRYQDEYRHGYFDVYWYKPNLKFRLRLLYDRLFSKKGVVPQKV